jgi:hypothetical protein
MEESLDQNLLYLRAVMPTGRIITGFARDVDRTIVSYSAWHDDM